eukprot:364602-Chlamydomonas_euryale.AAC.3
MSMNEGGRVARSCAHLSAGYHAFWPARTRTSVWMSNSDVVGVSSFGETSKRISRSCHTAPGSHCLLPPNSSPRNCIAMMEPQALQPGSGLGAWRRRPRRTAGGAGEGRRSPAR